MLTTIKCKYCGKEIEISEALQHEIQEETLAIVETRHQKELEEVKRKAKELNTIELKDQEEHIKELEQRTQKAEEEELKIRKEKRQLQEDKEKFEVEKQRQLDQERETIKKQAIQSVEEKDRFKFAEYEKKLADMKKAVDEAQRKGSQNSQQLQGEVLELDFEKLLKNTFPNDQIEPVEKGVKGADVRQTVLSPRGINCGVILWETKRTKDWKDNWTEKLKKDLRAEKANIPVIVSTVMPKEFKNPLGDKNGVQVVSFELAIPLARLLRKNLLDIGYQIAVSAHKGEKAENLYGYITGHEFRQQVEAMVETYYQMKNQIAKERAAYERMWREREKQVEKLFNSTANIAGSIQGEIGQGTFQIKGLELLELESGKKG